ncbi:MAG: hypothetical protein ACI9LM_004270 [Alteromonadaceae bacterium]|jgi:hypothetical protein
MTKQRVYEFETSRDANGQYVCHSYREVEAAEKSNSEKSSSAQPSSSFHAGFTAQDHIFSGADDAFAQSYQSNFTQGNDDYINNMRQQFSQMRQSMLDKMEKFTYVQNIKK